jgi:hypothetical protein
MNAEDDIVAYRNVKTSNTRSHWERREGFLIVQLWKIIRSPDPLLTLTFSREAFHSL